MQCQINARFVNRSQKLNANSMLMPNAGKNIDLESKVKGTYLYFDQALQDIFFNLLL